MERTHHQELENEDDPNALNSLSKFTLFETKSRFYITASTADTHRVLKIDRTDPTVLNVVEDSTVYDSTELDLLLRMVQDGNKSQGGLEKVLEFHGIVGFVKFTGGWYLILITKRSVVGLLGGHYIYHCDETTLLTIASKSERTAQETKMLNTFQQVDLSKNFYFSRTLRSQITIDAGIPGSCGTTISLSPPSISKSRKEEVDGYYPLYMASWIKPVSWENPQSVTLKLTPGLEINVFTRTVYLTLIARRSRHYAGARFLTRGANEYGHVANEVETEQIVSEPLATPFGRRYEADIDHPISDFGAGCGGYTSFVQYRGSIPVMWHQESNQMTPRPPIEITIKDPFYTPAAKHFDDLLGRYGAPIFILNLIKCRETVPRESKLLFEYGQCVEYLNQFLPEGKKMQYIAWDMAQAAKSGHQDVMGVLEDVCEESLQATNFFHGGPARSEASSRPHRERPLLQHGILRVNCVDCLDRTNAAQFAIAKRAFGHQLYALGLIGTPYLPFSCDAVDVLTEMYHDHGDTLAWQYTGSALVNRVDTYRRTKAAQWSSHSRDLLENIRRFYNNSMLDADKQSAINLFLGVQPSVPSYELARPNYRQWFTPSHLDLPKADELAPINHVYREYYKPHILSQFGRLYALKPKNEMLASPFETRVPAESSSPTTSYASDRRSARRWAAKLQVPGSPKSSSAYDGSSNMLSMGTSADPTPSSQNAPQQSKATLSHPLEALVTTLLDPSEADLKQRVEEYAWYTTYHAAGSNLVDGSTLGEEKDLQLYIRMAKLAEGQEVDRILKTGSTIAAAAAGAATGTNTNTNGFTMPAPGTGGTGGPGGAGVMSTGMMNGSGTMSSTAGHGVSSIMSGGGTGPMVTTTLSVDLVGLGLADLEKKRDEVGKVNGQFYETWLKGVT